VTRHRTVDDLVHVIEVVVDRTLGEGAGGEGGDEGGR
jgi:hypothetical protein